jgi:cobalt-precorrin 5A hydrolase
VQTYSPHSRCRFDVPSVAEAAALAGAGPGAVLIVPRIAQDGATCAIAGSAEGAA